MKQLQQLGAANSSYLLQGFVDRTADKLLYTIYWNLADLLWQLERMILSGALLLNGLRQWLVDNALELLTFMINGIAPIAAALLLLAIAVLGLQLAGSRVMKGLPQWIHPERLILMAFLSILFLGAPDAAIDALDEVRNMVMSVRAGESIDTAAIDFDTGTSGTPDEPLPTNVPDVLAVGPFAGVVDAFDLTAYYIQVDNIAVLDAPTLPPDFEATWFPNGEPSNFDLASESDREEALRLAADGNLRLLFGLISSGAVIAEQLLYLMLQAAAVVLYLGLPLAFALSYFVFTQSLLTQYIRQFINLLIETLWSMVVAGFAIWLMVTAGSYGVMYFFFAAVIAAILIYWRVISAGLLIMRGFSLLDGSRITGGAGIGSLARLATGAVTGGTALAAGAVMSVANRADAALQTTARVGAAGGLYAAGRYSANQAAQADSPVRRQQAIQRGRQLQAAAGYVAGGNERIGRVIEGVHEVRNITRRVRGNKNAAADGLDYVRVGQMQSHYKSNPWLSIGMSSGLQDAYQQMSGRGRGRQPRLVDPEAQIAFARGRGGNSAAMSSNTNGTLANGNMTASTTSVSTHPPSSNSVTLRGLDALSNTTTQRAPSQRPTVQSTGGLPNATGQPPPDAGSQRDGRPSVDAGSPLGNPVPTINVNAARHILDSAREIPADSRSDVDTLRTEVGEGSAENALPQNQSDDEPNGSAETASPQNEPVDDSVTSSIQDDEAATSAETLPTNPSTQPTVPTNVPQAISTLGNSDPAIRSQARAFIAATAGTRSARQIDALTDKHGHPAVQQSVQRTAQWLTRRQQAGATNETILRALQQGQAWTTDSPLSSAEQAAVAQAIVQPTQTVSGQNLAKAALNARAAGYKSDATAAWLGSSETLPEPLNAKLNTLSASADELGLSQREVLAVQADVDQHGAAATRTALVAEGHDPDQAALLVEALEQLPTQTKVTPDLRFERGDVQGFEAAAGYALASIENGTTDLGDIRERATVLAQTMSGMEVQAAPAAQQMAQQTAAQLTSPNEALQLQQTVQRVGSAPVQAAIQQVRRRVATQRTLGGETDAAIAASFADANGQAVQDLQNDLPDTPLTRSELQQIAAATLQPEVILSRQDLATAITQNAWQPNASQATLAERLQVTDFGQQTAAVRVAATEIAASGLEATTVQQVIRDIEADNLTAAHERLQKTKLPQLQTAKERAALITTLQQLPAVTRLRRRIVPLVEEDESEG